jgi:hypothetical protein
MTDSGGFFWTAELHELKGNVLFAYGHVEEWNNFYFNAFKFDPNDPCDLFLPTVKLHVKSEVKLFRSEAGLLYSEAGRRRRSQRVFPSGSSLSLDSAGAHTLSAGDCNPAGTAFWVRGLPPLPGEATVCACRELPPRSNHHNCSCCCG